MFIRTADVSLMESLSMFILRVVIDSFIDTTVASHLHAVDHQNEISRHRKSLPVSRNMARELPTIAHCLRHTMEVFSSCDV